MFFRRMKLWAIEDSYRNTFGLTVLQARTQEEAIEKFFNMHPDYGIEEIEEVDSLSLAMVQSRYGHTAYQRMP